jgi:hypothetical protein
VNIVELANCRRARRYGKRIVTADDAEAAKIA